MSNISVELPGVAVRKQAANEQLFMPRVPAVTVDEKTKLYDLAAEMIGADTPTSILEFGVAGGATCWHLTKRFKSPRTRFVGFDSFEGLPESWISVCPRGAFSTGGVAPQTDDLRISFVKGWFQNTVDSWLARNRVWEPVLIHFDADLYGFTLFLLTTLWHHVPDYFFLMDDFVHEDLVALYDFSRSYPAEIEFYGRTRNGSLNNDVPPAIQVFGRLRRVPFRVDGAPEV
jgi:hypothetical protein